MISYIISVMIQPRQSSGLPLASVIITILVKSDEICQADMEAPLKSDVAGAEAYLSVAARHIGSEVHCTLQVCLQSTRSVAEGEGQRVEGGGQTPGRGQRAKTRCIILYIVTTNCDTIILVLVAQGSLFHDRRLARPVATAALNSGEP
jgi:hypothetical protein